MEMRIPITAEDFIFSISSTEDIEGVVTRLLHVDVKNHPKFRFDFPLTVRNAKQLRATFNLMRLPEDGE